MIEKNVALNILEDIQQCLKEENWQSKVISTAKQYKYGILMSIDQELKEIVKKQKQCNEESPDAIELAKQFNKRKDEIYNS